MGVTAVTLAFPLLQARSRPTETRGPNMPKEWTLRDPGSYMLRSRAALLVCLAGASLGGCASFSGMPEPVIDFQTSTAIPADYQMATVLQTMSEETDPTRRRELRNRTISLYLAAADARYHQFRIALSRDAKGSNLGLDLAVLAITGIGSVAGSAANELSAAAAALTGSRASINRELYFERALPAIVTAMDTSRMRIRGEIMRRLREDDVVQYPLEQGFSDVINYQMAGSIDGAIQQITTAAGIANNEALLHYENAIESCDVDDSVAPYWARLNDFVYGLADAAENGPPASGSDGEEQLADLARVADLTGGAAAGTTTAATTFDDAQAQAAAIMNRSDSFCTVDSLNNLFTEIQTRTGRSIP